MPLRVSLSNAKADAPVNASRAIIWLAAIVVALLANAPQMMTAPRNTEREVSTGFDIADEMFYHSCARAAVERGAGGLFYANPYAFVPDPPRRYSQLAFVLEGWTWRLTGLSFVAIDRIARLLFGALFLALGAECLRARLAGRRFLWPAIAVLYLGGGGAWMFATFDTALYATGVATGDLFSGMTAPQWATVWFDRYSFYEFFPGAWDINEFRYLRRGHQAFYHALFFAGWLCLIRGWWKGAFVVSFLLWWSHPFTALNFATPLTATTIVLAFVERETPKRQRWTRVGIAVGLFMIGLAYYLAWLPTDPAHRSVQSQMRDFVPTAPAWRFIPGLGALFFAPLLMFWRPPQWRDRSVIAALSLIVCVVALTFHHRLLGWMGVVMQPLHFEQGYLFFGLLCLSCEMLTRGAREARARAKEAPSRGRRWRRIALALAWLSLFPDNVLFHTTWQWPHVRRGGVTLSRAEMDLVAFLGSIEEGRRVLFLDTALLTDWPGYAMVETPHTFIGGHFNNTPFMAERVERMKTFVETGDLSLWAENDPSLLVAPARFADAFHETIEPRGAYERLYESDGFTVYRINEMRPD